MTLTSMNKHDINFTVLVGQNPGVWKKKTQQLSFRQSVDESQAWQPAIPVEMQVGFTRHFQLAFESIKVQDGNKI